MTTATRPLSLLALLVSIPLLSACGSTGPDEKVEAGGVVEFVDVEGGCWSIRSAGTVYEPIDLPEEFRVDGLAVEFEGELRSDLASTCQVGQLIELDEIERAGSGYYPLQSQGSR